MFVVSNPTNGAHKIKLRTVKVLNTINPHPTRAVHDGRYRREHSNKSWGQSRGQRANRAKLKADALHDAYECAWERRDERRAERKRRRAS